MNTPTTFRPIKGFPGYAISEAGEVVSFKGHQPAFVKPHPARNGYLMVTLYDGKTSMRGSRIYYHRCCVTVHSLVAQAFLGPRPEGMVVDHIDGDKTNNSVTNLHYVTSLENSLNPVTYNRSKAAHSRRPLIVSKDGVDTIFPSVHEACRELKLSEGNVRKCLSPKYPAHQHHGYTFRRA